jgi:hypothetical protein
MLPSVPVFPAGPRLDVPADQTECRYGRWGRLGRAVRDVPGLAYGSGAGLGVLTYSGALSSGIFTIPADTPLWIRMALLFAFASGGLFVAGVVLFLWRLRPGAHKRHWSIRIESKKTTGHTRLILESRHYHRVLNLRCVVRDPTGVQWPADWLSQFRHHILEPGEQAQVTYPNDFYIHDTSDPKWTTQAMPPWPGRLSGPSSFPPMTGRFRVTWKTDVEHGEKPVTLASRTWRVE